MKKKRFPLRPLAVPTLLAIVTGFALVAALLDDGLVEDIAVALLIFVVGLVLYFLLLRRRPRQG